MLHTEIIERIIKYLQCLTLSLITKIGGIKLGFCIYFCGQYCFKYLKLLVANFVNQIFIFGTCLALWASNNLVDITLLNITILNMVSGYQTDL